MSDIVEGEAASGARTSANADRDRDGRGGLDRRDPRMSRAALGGYEPGLDGLRAIGMCFMLAYHAQFSWAKGAFFALSQFFTLSGFLITAILLRQHEKGGIRLRPFWVRRYRRLLPASLLTLAGVLVFGATVANELQVEQLPGQITASVAQVVNWYFIVTETSYIDLFVAPSPVQHFWSLAVEEQFYLVMPVVVYVLLRTTRSVRAVGAVLAVGAVASTAWMLVLYRGGASLDRLYYGTDTRAAEMLVGALLAVVLHRHPLRPGPLGRKVLAVVGVVAFAISAWCLTSVPLADGPVWQGGFLVFALVTAALIVSIMGRSGPIAALYSVGLLAAIGRITYGLYLFHWPIFLWLTPERTGLDQIPLFGLRLAVTFGLAVLSYRFFEMPIRDGYSFGVRGAARWALIPAASVIVILGGVLVGGRDVVSTDPLVVASSEMPEVERDAVLDVLVIADDAGAEVATAMADAAEGAADLTVEVAAPFGCGEVVDTPTGPVCPAWVEEWSATIEDEDPDAVLLLVSRWDPAELAALSGGLGGAELATWTEELLANGVGLLSERGAPVVWAAVPPDFAALLARQDEPFHVAMTRLATSRDDVRRAQGERLVRDVLTGTPVAPDEAAAVLLEDLELHRRNDAGDATRVLVVGDSVALTLGYGLEQWAASGDEVVVWNSATEGCGIADEGMLREMAFREAPVSDRCRAVATTRAQQIEQFDPDVVVVLTSVWDLQERRLPEWDGYRRPGDPEFDAYVLREYREAADVLSSGGARIVWVQAPCARPPSGDPGTATSSGPYETARVRHLNETLLPQLAEGRTDVALFDLFRVVCPGGEFVESLGGVEDLRPDGVHFSRDGALWLAETQGEALLGAGV